MFYLDMGEFPQYDGYSVKDKTGRIVARDMPKDEAAALVAVLNAERSTGWTPQERERK